jgi:hypothetical protein
MQTKLLTGRALKRQRSNVENHKRFVAERKKNNRRGNRSQQGARQSLNLEQSIGVDDWAKYPSLTIHVHKSRALESIGRYAPK